jgi:hypothetical protein
MELLYSVGQVFSFECNIAVKLKKTHFRTHSYKTFLLCFDVNNSLLKPAKAFRHTLYTDYPHSSRPNKSYWSLHVHTV